MRQHWKLEYVITTFYKTISNIVISDCNNKHICNVFTLDGIIGKVTISASSENLFFKDFGTGILKQYSSKSKLPYFGT